MKPVISIVIPIYNAAKYIERCMKSILSQTFQDFEVILVDDASKDDSVAVIRSAVKGDIRFVLLAHEENMGAMKARETGYLPANGDYIIFCDADDWLPSTALESLLIAIEKTRSDIVVGQFDRIDDNGNITSVTPNRLLYGNDVQAVFKSLLKGELTHSLCGRIFKKSLFDASLVCKKDFNNGEDGLLFYQLVERALKIEVINDIVYYYYQNLSQNSNTAAKLTEKRAFSILFFMKFTSKYFGSNEELWRLYQDRCSLEVISLLRHGIPKNFVCENMPEFELGSKVMLRSFCGVKKEFVRLFLFCTPARLLINKLLDMRLFVRKKWKDNFYDRM